MFKPISTRTHGIIDYAFSASLLTLPFMLGWGARARKLSVGAGLATLGNSMMTNYELGLIDLLPMKAHLSVDAAESSVLLSARKLLGNGDRGAARIIAIMGTAASAVAALTKTRSPEEIAESARPQLAHGY